MVIVGGLVLEMPHGTFPFICTHLFIQMPHFFLADIEALHSVLGCSIFQPSSPTFQCNVGFNGITFLFYKDFNLKHEDL